MKIFNIPPLYLLILQRHFLAPQKGLYVGQKATGDHVPGFNYNFGDVTDHRAVSFWAFSGFAAHRLQFHERCQNAAA